MGVLVAFGAALLSRCHADECLPCLTCPDGGLYTATRYEFRSLPDIRRNLHQRPLKTEESPLHWLNGEMSPSSPGTNVPGCGVPCITLGSVEQGWALVLGSCVVFQERT